jgi:maltose O-acetyltransferase
MKNGGRNFQVTHGAILNTTERLNVGNDVYIGHNVIIAAGGEIRLDDEVMIGHNTVIVSSNHTNNGRGFRSGGRQEEIIILEKGSWVGANCCILGGSILPEGSVLGAGSVLREKFGEKNSLYAGLPARFIKKL